MDWLFLDSGSHDGSFNMKLDLKLAHEFNEHEAIFRLYRWSPYCISLGANQNINSIDESLLKKDNLDLVRRPTGGRAVLHSEELTYSVIYPLDFTSSARGIYHSINSALAEGLKLYDAKLDKLELEQQTPDFNSLYRNEGNVACFAVSAKSEIQYNGRKLVGSAQRKFDRVILQHGSILCGSFHKKITDYLTLEPLMIEQIRKEIEEHTITLEEITGEPIDYEFLSRSLYSGFEKYFKTKFSHAEQLLEI